MKAICYFRVHGPSFDDEGFAAAAEPIMPRLAVVRKGTPLQARSTNIWQSQPIEIKSQYGEQELLDLARAMRTTRNSVTLPPNAAIDLVIARTPEQSSELCGFYFCSELLHLLASIGAGIDYDVVEFLPDRGL